MITIDGQPGGGRQTFAVTPPGGNGWEWRRWIELEAQSSGWTALEWTDGDDRYGMPMGTLTGVPPGKDGDA